MIRIINLGYANEWNGKKREIFEELRENKIYGSDYKYIVKGLTEFSFETFHENERVEVVYRSDKEQI